MTYLEQKSTIKENNNVRYPICPSFSTPHSLNFPPSPLPHPQYLTFFTIQVSILPSYPTTSLFRPSPFPLPPSPLPHPQTLFVSTTRLHSPQLSHHLTLPTSYLPHYPIPNLSFRTPLNSTLFPIIRHSTLQTSYLPHFSTL